MEALYSVEGQNARAVIRLPFEGVSDVLLRDRQWAANVLAAAGKGAIRVGYAKAYGAVLGSSVVRRAPGYLLIRGTAGKNTRLMYAIRAIDTNTTQITPEGRLSMFAMIAVPVGLMLLCFIPVVLTPLFYWGIASGMRRNSARYLDALCRYVAAQQPA